MCNKIRITFGVPSGFDNCKKKWNKVGPQSWGLQSGTTTSAEARVTRISCRKIHRATTSLPCWRRICNFDKSASWKQRELSHRSELVYKLSSADGIAKALRSSTSCTQHTFLRLVSHVFKQHLWLLNRMSSSVARHKEHSIIFIGQPCRPFRSHTRSRHLLHPQPHFHRCRAQYPAGRSHEMRMCGTIATEILLTFFMSSTSSTSLEDYEGKTRFWKTRNSPNSSITTPTGSTWILLKLTMSTSGASLLHHCQRRREEQEQTWKRVCWEAHSWLKQERVNPVSVWNEQESSQGLEGEIFFSGIQVQREQKDSKIRRELVSMKTTIAIWEVRLILEIGISDVLFKGRWKPVKLEVDFDKKYQSMNELSMKTVSEDFKKLKPRKGIMNLMSINFGEKITGKSKNHRQSYERSARIIWWD